MNLQHSIIYLIFFLCFSIFIEAQNLHFIIFADTTDIDIGKGNKRSLERLEKLGQSMERSKSIDSLAWYRYLDKDFTKENLFLLLDSLRESEAISSSDIVWFYFLGHGQQSGTDTWPSLMFNSKSWKLSEIDDKLNRLNAQLTLCMAEACNNSSAIYPGPFSQEESSNSAYVAASIDTIFQYRGFKDLFTLSKGSAIVSSSSFSEESYINETEGGIFTRVFCNAMLNCGKKKEVITWKKLLQKVRSETKEFTKKEAEKQNNMQMQTPSYVELIVKMKDSDNHHEKWADNRVAFFSDLMAEFSEEKREREKIRLFKATENFRYLEEILSPEKRQKQHNENPLSYYVFKAILAKQLNGHEDALIFFNVATELNKRGIVTKKDTILLNTMRRLDTKYQQIGYADLEYRTDWLAAMCKIYQNKIKHHNSTPKINGIIEEVIEHRQ